MGIEKETMRSLKNGFYPVCFVSKDDCASTFDGEPEESIVKKFSEADMKQVCDFMRENMVGDVYWDIIRLAVEQVLKEKGVAGF